MNPGMNIRREALAKVLAALVLATGVFAAGASTAFAADDNPTGHEKGKHHHHGKHHR